MPLASEWVLTDGPFKGLTIAESLFYRRNEDNTLTRSAVREPTYAMRGSFEWMSWFISHPCQWQAKAKIVHPDRNAIAKFFVTHPEKSKYYAGSKPYQEWADQFDQEADHAKAPC